ncbi:MAG: EamA family transporter [Pseudomonadota bacterium]
MEPDAGQTLVAKSVSSRNDCKASTPSANLSISSVIAGNIVRLEGAKRMPSGQTALISALETTLAPLLAFLVLAEIPRPTTVVGGGIIVFAVWLGASRTNDLEKQ